MLIRYNNQDVFSGQAEPLIGKTKSFTSAGDNRILIEETISLVGELTGCGSGELIDARSGALEVFSTGFKNLEVSGIGTFTGVKINALNFDQSPYLNTLPYSIELLHYPSGGYEFGYGITSPQSTYTYTENTNQTVSIQHEVSAQGINTSSIPGGNALTNAQNFVSGQITGAVPRPALINTTSNKFNTYLVDFSETVDKLNNTVSVSRSFESDPTDLTAYGGNVIMRHSSGINLTEGEEVTVTVNGEINAGRPTGDALFWHTDGPARMAKVRSRYRTFRESMPAPRFLTENVTEDTGINLLSFALSYVSGNNQEADGIMDDFTITLEENSDSSLFSVSVNGNLTTRGRCIGDAFGKLSGYYGPFQGVPGEFYQDHRFDVCQSLYGDFYTEEHGSCQDLQGDALQVGLSKHSISKSVAYNEHAASLSYSASYNDRAVIDSVGENIPENEVFLHSFDYTMSFTPSLPGIKSVASAYNNGWIFEDLGYRKRANFSISTTAKPLSTTTIRRSQLYQFGELKFQSMVGPQVFEIVATDEFGVGNQSAMNATYAKSFHAGAPFVDGECSKPNSYTGIVGSFNIGKFSQAANADVGELPAQVPVEGAQAGQGISKWCGYFFWEAALAGRTPNPLLEEPEWRCFNDITTFHLDDWLELGWILTKENNRRHAV